MHIPAEYTVYLDSPCWPGDDSRSMAPGAEAQALGPGAQAEESRLELLRLRLMVITDPHESRLQMLWGCPGQGLRSGAGGPGPWARSPGPCAGALGLGPSQRLYVSPSRRNPQLPWLRDSDTETRRP